MVSDAATRLARLRAEAEARVLETEADLEALTRARRSETDDDEHDPEGVTLSTEWSRLSGVRDLALAELREIERAQERLSVGTYGVCRGCGESIPQGRLEARPFAEFCVPCAERLGL